MARPFDFEEEGHYLQKRIEGSVFGETQEGRAWVIKSLDPSVETTVMGMPDTTTLEVGIEKYKQTIFIRSPNTANAMELYDFEIRQTGHPIAPFDVFITPRSAPTDLTASFTYFNNQIAGGGPESEMEYLSGSGASALTSRKTKAQAAYTAKTAEFTKLYQKARLLYQSITIRQSASSNYDQGTVIAVQQDMNASVTYDVFQGPPVAVSRLATYGAVDFPTINNAANLDRCYEATSAEGVFMPLHLSLDYIDWKNLEDQPMISSPALGATNTVQHLFATVTDKTKGITPMCATGGSIFILGVPPSTSFQCTYRGGFEGIPYAGSESTTHIFRSPAYDPVALKAFSQISRELLNDAYPSSWNDGGTLWSWIKNKAADVLPYIPRVIGGGVMGAITGGIPGAVRGATNAWIDKYTENQKRKRGANSSRDLIVPSKGARVEFVD